MFIQKLNNKVFLTDKFGHYLRLYKWKVSRTNFIAQQIPDRKKIIFCLIFTQSVLDRQAKFTFK
jgi:hypothetical protein